MMEAHSDEDIIEQCGRMANTCLDQAIGQLAEAARGIRHHGRLNLKIPIRSEIGCWTQLRDASAQTWMSSARGHNWNWL